MAVVYEAEQRGVQGFVKRIALKVIKDNFARHPLFRANFIGEAKLVADLIHTNIVQTYHLGETPTCLYIAMELIRGVALDQMMAQHVDKRRRLPRELAVFIASRVARALAYAHAKRNAEGHLLGIVHRDVSFKNILLSFEGDVKLSDFGIAKAQGYLTDEEGEVVAGKSDYMSPEQANFKITDHRSDLFSTGIVLAELLLGYNIFRADSSRSTRKRVIAGDLPDFPVLCPEVDDRLDAILKKALCRSVDERYQNAEDLLRDLELYIYRDGYGPTNETMGKYLRELFGQHMVTSAVGSRSDTVVLGPR